jgi:tripartite-type tricarboxylate transporter receptor subunit TctC
MKIIRSTAAVAALCAITWFTTASAQAQTFPDRTISLVVPFAPGGAADTTGRIMADAMSRRLGKAVIVENVGGAGGSIGTARVKHSRPDGYTIGIGHTGTLAAAVAVTPNLQFDPRTDFDYLGLVSFTPNIIFVRKDLPANNLKDFIAYARAKGPALKIGHSGIGAASHITSILFFQLIGANPTLVPYRGFGQTVIDIMSGQIDGSCDLVASVSPYVKSGQVRALVVAADERSPAVPNVPTAAEAGLPHFNLQTWTGIYGPTGIPAPVLATLQKAVEDSLNDPEVQKRFATIGAAVPKAGQRGGAYMHSLVKTDVARWINIMEKAGLAVQQKK